MQTSITESRLVVDWEWRRGNYKVTTDTCKGKGCNDYLDYDDGFTGVHMPKLIQL